MVYESISGLRALCDVGSLILATFVLCQRAMNYLPYGFLIPIVKNGVRGVVCITLSPLYVKEFSKNCTVKILFIANLFFNQTYL